MFLKHKHLIYNHEGKDYILTIIKKEDLDYCSQLFNAINQTQQIDLSKKSWSETTDEQSSGLQNEG